MSKSIVERVFETVERATLDETGISNLFELALQVALIWPK